MVTIIPRFFHAIQSSLLGLALASTAAWADPPGRVGRISDTVGTVWFYDQEQGDWVAARRNRPVTDGDRFTTERGARVEVQIGSATVRLGGSAEATFDELDDQHVHLHLKQGTVALQLRRDELAREVAVTTTHGRFEPLRAGSYRVDVQDSSVLGAALSGAIRYESRDSALTLESGQRAEFWKERGDVTHYAWVDPANDNFAEWVRREEREERDNRYASPEMTGADDLQRHGRWESHVEYGSIWYPHRVAAGWAPYRDGHWAYIRPWGWTWVDNAPWGFAPFHYGRWVHYSGRWGWVPPDHVAVRPVYSPALVGWIGNGNVSVSVNIGHPGYVGWVPLSPYDRYQPHYHAPVSRRYIESVNVPYQQWYHRGRGHSQDPRPDPRRDAVMAQPVPYTNQGVAGGVTVVSRDVLRQRQPVTQGTMASPGMVGNVTQWQSVQPEAPAVMTTPRAVGATPPPAVFRSDDGREGVRRGPSQMMSAPQAVQTNVQTTTQTPAMQSPVSQPVSGPIPMPSARPQTPPVASLPAATSVTQPSSPVPRAMGATPPPAVFRHDDGREGVRRGPPPMISAPQVAPPSTVQAPVVQAPMVQQSIQRQPTAPSNSREEQQVRAQEQQQRKEQVRRMERQAPGQRND